MLLIDSLAEERIQAAIRRGELDDLPGQGNPLVLEDDSGIPEELRVGYRILRNAGCLPPELTLRNEIHQLEALLDRVDLGTEPAAIRRRLYLLKARLAMQGRDGNLLVRERVYREKLVEKVACDNKSACRTGRADAPAAGDSVA